MSLFKIEKNIVVFLRLLINTSPLFCSKVVRHVEKNNFISLFY